MTTEIAAGPELDALIAEKVMGWVPHTVAHDCRTEPCYLSEEDYIVDPDSDVVWLSTTYEGMGLVLERMRELGWWSHMEMQTHEDGQPCVVWFEMDGEEYDYEIGDTLPAAVARAALAAVEAEG